MEGGLSGRAAFQKLPVEAMRADGLHRQEALRSPRHAAWLGGAQQHAGTGHEPARLMVVEQTACVATWQVVVEVAAVTARQDKTVEHAEGDQTRAQRMPAGVPTLSGKTDVGRFRCQEGPTRLERLVALRAPGSVVVDSKGVFSIIYYTE